MTTPWIPVERAVPDDDQTVLIYSEQCDPPVWLGYRDAGDWYSADCWRIRVTHWQPMPEPPTGAA